MVENVLLLSSFSGKNVLFSSFFDVSSNLTPCCYWRVKNLKCSCGSIVDQNQLAIYTLEIQDKNENVWTTWLLLCKSLGNADISVDDKFKRWEKMLKEICFFKLFYTSKLFPGCYFWIFLSEERWSVRCK